MRQMTHAILTRWLLSGLLAAAWYPIFGSARLNGLNGRAPLIPNRQSHPGSRAECLKPRPDAWPRSLCWPYSCPHSMRTSYNPALPVHRNGCRHLMPLMTRAKVYWERIFTNPSARSGGWARQPVPPAHRARVAPDLDMCSRHALPTRIPFVRNGRAGTQMKRQISRIIRVSRHE